MVSPSFKSLNFMHSCFSMTSDDPKIKLHIPPSLVLPSKGLPLSVLRVEFLAGVVIAPQISK